MNETDAVVIGLLGGLMPTEKDADEWTDVLWLFEDRAQIAWKWDGYSHGGGLNPIARQPLPSPPKEDA